MTYLLIDPPIGPFSPRSEIRLWLEELERKARRYPGNPQVAASREMAEEWMRLNAREGLERLDHSG